MSRSFSVFSRVFRIGEAGALGLVNSIESADIYTIETQNGAIFIVFC
jgi:hypothetical protein